MGFGLGGSKIPKNKPSGKVSKPIDAWGNRRGSRAYLANTQGAVPSGCLLTTFLLLAAILSGPLALLWWLLA